MAESACITEEGRRLVLRWRGGGESAYPAVWLRDNCRCPECFVAEKMHVRTILMEHLDVTCTLTNVKLSEDGEEVTVSWTDGHTSAPFSCCWLKVRAFESAPQRARGEVCRPPLELWDGSLAEHLPRADFTAVMQDDAALLDALLKLERYGLVLLEDAPRRQGECTRFCDRVAYLRDTHFGAEEFTVRVRVDPTSIAYTGKNIEVHTDLPYYDYMPSIQMLHFIVQYDGKGGETQLADAAKIAKDLKEEDPDAFETLTTVKVNFKNITMGENGKHNFKLLQAPVITMDDDGNLKFLRFTTSQRDSFFSVPIEKVEPWYRATKKLLHMLYDPKYMIRRKMNEGDIVVFDNVRVVHGREPLLEAENVGERLLAGTYLDWDEVRSRRRVLQERSAGNPSGYGF